MKLIFGLSFILFVFSSIGQNQISGEYISIAKLSTNVIDTSELILNCDKTFSSKSSFSSMSGRWRQKNSKRLILLVDSAINNSNPDLKKRQINLRIDSDTLCWKGLTKHQRNKLKREIERGAGENQEFSPNPSDNNKNNNCFKKLLTYTCG
jgi:hypothetical protein